VNILLKTTLAWYDLKILANISSILLGNRTQGLFRTFEDFEFRAALADRKNTPSFAAAMVIFFAIFMIKIRSKVCCNFGRTSQGDVVGRISAHYIAGPANLYLLLRL
jgi:hypothetical protein